jgi:hypothetical protein
MSKNVIQYKTQTIRDTIKSIVAQLDRWETDQRALEKRCTSANASYPKGVIDRQALAIHRAQLSQRTSPDLTDPPCDWCDSTGHLSDECDRVARDSGLISTSEDPAIGIHRAIVHRLYLQTCDLYCILYPRFYPGPKPKPETEEKLPVPFIGPDYLALAITQAAEDFRVLPGYRPSDIRNLRPGCSSVTQLYYSKAFVVSYSEFCSRVADSVEESYVESD